MNQPSTESQLRALLQRVKHADEEVAPPFEAVLNRPVREASPPSSRQSSSRSAQLAIGSCVVVALLVMLFVQLQPRDMDAVDQSVVTEEPVAPTEFSPVQQDDRAPMENIVGIDFDQLMKVIEKHSGRADAGAGSMSVWSSRTDSLLALNLNVSISED